MSQLDRRFVCLTAILAIVLTAIVYKDVFRGKVPFPSFFVFEFPSFARSAPARPLQEPATISDLVMSFYPFHVMAARAVRNGEVPLWNPYMLSGTPLLANAQSAVFYPFNVLYYMLPAPIAWSLGFVLRSFLVILFTAGFVRALGGTATGSLAAAVLFAFCGFLTAWQGQAMSDAAIWLPLICWMTVSLHRQPSARLIAVAAVAFAMPVLAGHPETAAHVTLTALALAALLASVQPSRKFVLSFGAAGGLAVGIAAVQILPTVEWLMYVQHSLRESWPPNPLWSALGWVSRDVLHAKNSFGLQIPEQAAYIGMIAFAGAPLALLHRSKSMVFFFTVWTAIVVSIAYGIGPMFWLSRHIPVVQGLKNARLIFIGAFGVAVLTGLGISEIQTWDAASLRKFRDRAALLIFAGSFFGLSLILLMRRVTIAVSEPSRYPRVSAALLLLSVLPLILRLMNKLNRLAFSLAVVGIVCLDAVSFSYGFVPSEDSRFIFPQVDIFNRLPKNDVEPFRIAQVAEAYVQNSPSIYGLSDTGGYEVCLRRIKYFLEDLTDDNMAVVEIAARRLLDTRDRRLDMLNTRYYVVSQWNPVHLEFAGQPDRFHMLYSTHDCDVYESPNALGAAFIVPADGVEVIPDDEQARSRLKDPAFDPRRSIVLDRPLPEGIPEPLPTSARSISSSVEWLSRRSGNFELKVASAARAVLVISQVFYPGWTAFIDGKPSTVMPADFALTSIQIPPGTHQVRFEFRSPSFRLGLWISVISLAVLAGLAGFHGFAQKRRWLKSLSE